MPDNRRIVYLLVALVLAGIAFWITQSWLETEVSRVTASAEADDEASTTRVLVARQTLNPGTILTADHVEWQPWPDQGIVAPYFTEGTDSLESVTGSVVRTSMFPGQPLTSEAIAKPGEGSVMSAVLRPGYRAVTIAVTASTGVAGFISPGDRVDLILSRVIDGPGGAKRVTSETVLRDVRVVGIDQRAANQNNEVIAPQTATIEVTPAQAEMVVAASELGKLTLALRSVANARTQETADVTPSWLLQGTQAAPARDRPPARARDVRRQSTVEVIRGTSTSVEGGNS